jgi:hypothetical protein
MAAMFGCVGEAAGDLLLDWVARLNMSSRLTRFSNMVLQALLVLLKKKPPKGHKLLVVGTTSNQSVLSMMGIIESFSHVMHVDNITDGSEVGALFLFSTSHGTAMGHGRPFSVQILAILNDVQAFGDDDMAIIRKALSHGMFLGDRHWYSPGALV